MNRPFKKLIHKSKPTTKDTAEATITTTADFLFFDSFDVNGSHKGKSVEINRGIDAKAPNARTPT
jgi:hypothetical protein